MNESFITEIKLNNKEILNDLYIPLSKDEKKHLIITGKNGSGKTTLIKYIKDYLREKLDVMDEDTPKFASERDMKLIFNEPPDNEEIDNVIVNIINSKVAKEAYAKGEFIVCYLDSMRGLEMDVADGAEKVILEDRYNFKEKPYRLLIKYMIHLKTMQAFAKNENDTECDKVVSEWFSRFENVLKKLWDCSVFNFKYDYRRYDFKIYENNKEPYNLFQLSDGYLSVLRIFSDIMMRMERNWLSKGNLISTYDLKGIVLIDEIETHLHIALQKSILPCLIEIFPNIQFIVSTHSPYVLNSVDNAVIYDLENHTCYDDFSMYSAEEISESYFDAEKFSKHVAKTIEEYKELLVKQDATNEEKAKRASLRHKLNSLPRNIKNELFEEFDKLEKRD